MGMPCRRELQKKELVLGMSAFASWPGAMDKEGCLLGELGCLPILLTCPTQTELFHIHQPTEGHLLVALPGMTTSHCSSGQPLANLLDPSSEIISSKNSSLTPPWPHGFFSASPASST